ncbi:Acetyl-coenzyme A synthetase 2-like, mitochondrial, partial [Kappamyces sp. JEL0680]
MTAHPPPQFVGHKSHLSPASFSAMYQESIKNPTAFFGTLAGQLLEWIRPFDRVSHGSFADGDQTWFLNGQLNVSVNCVDRHAFASPDKVAIIYEPDQIGQSQKITYLQLLRAVCQFANVLKKYGVRKGDRVAIYMPNTPEAMVAMLACARIGAVHSVIFAGFSSDAVRDRVLDADCQIVVTADQ